MLCRHKAVRQGLNFAAREGLRAAAQPPEDPPNVRVNGCCALAERDGGHRAGGVRPDARQPFQRLDASWEPPAALHNHDSREPVEVDRATVVAEARPGSKDGGEMGRGQRLDGRKSVEETSPVLPYPTDLGLLEHDLRHQDRVRVTSPTKGQFPAVSREPRQDGVLDLGRSNALWNGSALNAQLSSGS